MWLEIEVHEDEVDTKIIIIINNMTNFVIKGTIETIININLITTIKSSIAIIFT